MVVRRRKKHTKYRGSRTMGKGVNDRNRAKGIKGGSGKAGWKFKAHKLLLLKRKYPEIWEDKKGFIPPTRIELKTITLEYINHKLPEWISNKIVEEKEGKYFVDLDSMGYDKILGTGSIEYPIIVKVKYASKGAIEKIKKASGEVILEN